MALTPSNMLPIGTLAPDFRLPDTDGKLVGLHDFDGSPALVIAFICNHCPFVKHIREALAQFGANMQAKGVPVIAISSNDITTHPADSTEKMKEEKESAGYTFPYLYDADQSVAAAYQAACTPDFYLFDSQQKLAYRGQFCDARPGNDLKVTGEDLRKAVDQLLIGQTVSDMQKPSIGCNIKWTPGREPVYAR